MHAQRDITFGKFRLDFNNECLWQGARSIALRPKAFAVLKLLIEHPGQLVSKQQVLDTVWPGTFVGDAVLKDNIRQLREALDDDAACPAYIETAHRRGYRFIAKPAPPANGPVPALSRPPRIGDSAQPASLLGRDAELGRMHDWQQRALAGDRQILFVTGEPGIGKTTIVNAFLESARQTPRVLVARGQCLEHYGAGEPYLPVLDGFSRLCRSDNGKPVLETLRQHAPAWLAQMSTLLPQSEREALQAQAAGTTRERMLREMAEAIESLTSESALLLVLEDLHWSDFSTLDLISYLARRRDFARLMIIGTYRPVDLILSDHPLKGVKRELQAHGLCHELPLEYLSQDSVGQYLATRFPRQNFPTRLHRAIYLRTEGNPLFMVNMVEYLTDQKMVVEEDGNWKLRVDLSHVEQGVPFDLRQLIEKQIERLTPDERNVLEAASVAGVECSSVAIAAGLEKSVEWAETHCEELARRHRFLSPAWLVELPDGSVTPRHRFTHVLYRDVPYRLIPAMRRAQIHHRIAERGIAIYGHRKNEIAAELAMHFEQSRDWPRTLEYCVQAAENAAARSANHEAIDLANRGLGALKLVPQTPEHARREMKLRMILIVSLTAIKGFASPEVEVINAQGRDLFWQNGPSPELFYMLWSLNMYRQFSGEMRSSLEICFQLMQLAKDLGDQGLITEAYRALGAVLMLSGRCPEALDYIEKGAAQLADSDDHRIFVSFDNRVMIECFAAMTLWDLGYPDKSAKRLAAGLALARKCGHMQTLVVAMHIAAQVHQLRGEASPSYVYAKEALDLSNEYGLAVWRAYGLIETGWAEAEMGATQQGIEKMHQGLAEYETTGAKLRCMYFLGLLADQLGKAGRLEEATATIAKAMALAEQTSEGYTLPELYRMKGEVLLKSSDTIQAHACFAEALKIAKQQGAKSLQLRAALSMHRLELMLKKSCRTQLTQIYSSFTEGFNTPDMKAAKEILEQEGPRS